MRITLSILLLLAIFSLQPLVHTSGAKTISAQPEFQHPLIYREASLSSPGSPPYVPVDIRQAYDFTPVYARGINGSGTHIAIIDAYGDPNLSSDLTSFNSLTGLPPATVNLYYPDGTPSQRNSGWAVETALDVEWAHAIAPGATIDNIVAYNSNTGSVFDAIAYVANNLPNETALSMSFGQSETNYPTTGSYTIANTHQLLATITSHGTTAFASSGDSGAASCCSIQYPASDPLVVAVGGTSLTLNATDSILSESAWSGSTAGSSIIFTKPSWQQGLGDSNRDTVDVAYDANPNTGVLVVQGGKEYQIGGTSIGAPQWAGLVSLASQAGRIKYGAVNARLYSISSYHDITTGSDGFFSATTGWDYPTGLGSPDANATVNSLLRVPISINNTNTFQDLSIRTSGDIIVDLGSSKITGSTLTTVTNTTDGSVLVSENLTINVKYSTGSNPRIVLVAPLRSETLGVTCNIALAPTPTASTIVSKDPDIDRDGAINVFDLSILLSSFGTSTGSQGFNPAADLNGNGTVDSFDLSIFLSDYGAPIVQ